jgi:hypothetical protein
MNEGASTGSSGGFTPLEMELKSRPGDQRRLLLRFFGHSNMQVRLSAAHANLAIDYPDISPTPNGVRNAGMTLINLQRDLSADLNRRENSMRRSTRLSCLPDSELLARFEKLCVEQYNALDRQEYAAFNRRYDRIQAIIVDQRRILLQLFGHPNMQVRLTAARATLAVDYLAARREIQEIAASKWYPQAGDAGISLENIDTGFFRPS